MNGKNYRNCRKIGVMTTIFVLAVLLSSGWSESMAQESMKSAGDDTLAKLYSAAKKEGEVVVWGPTDIVIFDRAQVEFGKQYPGIKIDYFESLPDPLVQRIITEKQAGKPSSVDIIHSGSMRGLRPLIEREMLISNPAWRTEFNLDALYLDDRLVGFYNLAFPISYNAKLVSEKDVPKTWEGLLDPKWKGRRIIVEARLVPFAILGTEWGQPKMIEYTKKLLSQDPIILKGGTTSANALASGQAAIAVGTYSYKIEALDKAGAQLKWIPVNPLPILSGAFGVLKDAPHPNAAILFAGFMGSPQGQKILYESTGQAVLVGKNATGVVAEKIKAANPKILLESEKNFREIVDNQRELGKLLGALK